MLQQGTEALEGPQGGRGPERALGQGQGLQHSDTGA